MAWPEWVEIVSYIKDRWPSNVWPDGTIRAYFHDLRMFEAADVWSAVYALYPAGRSFPPSGSELVAAAREARKRKADPSGGRGLPAPDDGAMTLSDYLALRGFASFEEAVKAKSA